MTGLHDHPLRADCSTCRFAGCDGDFGELETCDSPLDEHADDDIWKDILAWIDGRKAGPCPGWQPMDLCDERSIEGWLASQGVQVQACD